MNELHLNNGDKFTWTEFGDTTGIPVFYFHGIPGSRIEAQPADAAAQRLGLRIIALDRAGYGDSNPQIKPSLIEWPNVVSELADNLELQRFSLLGFSGGGPYALACAFKLSDRVSHISLVSSLAPFETPAMQTHINPDFKPLYELSVSDQASAVKVASQMASSPLAFLNNLKSAMPQCDNNLFTETQLYDDFLNNVSLAINNGVDGLIDDLSNVTQNWGFNLNEIKQPIDIWHGNDDKNVGVAVGKYLANTLSNSSPHFLNDCGHYFILKNWQQILTTLKNQHIN